MQLVEAIPRPAARSPAPVGTVTTDPGDGTVTVSLQDGAACCASEARRRLALASTCATAPWRVAAPALPWRFEPHRSRSWQF
ncbi:hypothetical protein B0B51_14740 [blood disease bacterium A2-HR MARDI]|uniref:Uncharacterized protein n=1 Tax=blood disease bacterium A2-HR MARDI TaxID=1944648 RepID=A0A1U9VK26_9RALS|nr:hypothetical protein B0B51_14740 [blood disease bacterium A2-HR MARDI]